MAILHIVISIAVWTLIFRWSPFETVEKCLLPLSYFLFWEYFVISRNYALLALIGFAFVALQQHRPQQNVIPWLLLGLLANTHVLGAIWSIALGSTFVIKRGRLTPRFVAGAAIYLGLLAFSVKTAAPAPDVGPWATDVRFDAARFGSALLFPVGPLLRSTPRGSQTRYPSWLMRGPRQSRTFGIPIHSRTSLRLAKPTYNIPSG